MKKGKFLMKKGKIFFLCPKSSTPFSYKKALSQPIKNDKP